MSYLQDFTDYISYRGNTNQPIDLDTLVLLYKVADLIEQNTFPQTGFALASHQLSQLTALTTLTSTVLAGFGDVDVDLEAIKVQLTSIIDQATLSNTKFTAANALLTTINAAVGNCDAKEAEQIQANNLLGQLITRSNLLGTEATASSISDSVDLILDSIVTSESLLDELATTKHTATITSLSAIATAVGALGTSIPGGVGTELVTLEGALVTANAELVEIEGKVDDAIALLDDIKTNTTSSGNTPGTGIHDQDILTKVTLIEDKLDALDDMTVALNSIYQSLVLSRNGNGIGGTLINTPNIINLVLTAANTAYTHIFPSTARQISFTARAAAGETQNTIYYAYTQNQVQTLSGTHILTLKPGETKTITSLFLQEPLTIYFASPVAGTIVAIEWWIVAS